MKEVATLQMGPYSITVVECDLPEDDGQWSAEKHTVRINKDLSEVEKKATLIHELIHAASDLWGLDLDEVAVRILENALVQAGVTTEIY